MNILSVFFSQTIVWLVVFLIGGVLYKKWKRRRQSNDIARTSVLLSYYTNNKDLTLLGHGTITEDIAYTAIATISQSGDNIHGSSAPKNSLMYRVQLPFHTKIHLLGIPKNGYATPLRPMLGKNAMEYVNLEGDFGNYFDLYTDKGNQTKARYLLDPKTMAFVIDFCMSHSWEVIEDELYFVETDDTRVTDDPTTMFDDILHFVNEIRPAVELKSVRHKLAHRSPYGAVTHRGLKCPVCQQKLITAKHWYECPQHHGVLINGRELIALRKGKNKLHIPNTDSAKPIEHGSLQCPSCGNDMSPTPYASSHVIIDSCDTCPFRWIDSGELEQIVL